MKSKEGDIYFWTWKGDRHTEDYSYWCKSRYAVVDELGRLVDTYTDTGMATVLEPESVELKYLGNPDEMTEIRTYDVEYYDSESVLDLRHANNSSGPIYLKNGAQKDPDKIRKIIMGRIYEAKNEIRFAIDTIQSLERKLLLMEQGKIDEVYL